MKICCIVPIKHNSERVPGKNYRSFNGKPLFEIIVEKLLKCNMISTIVIDTNSPIIESAVQDKYKEKNIILYRRPEHLWSGTTPTNVLIENVIQDLNLKFDLFIQTHVTNPLLSIETIKKCIETYKIQLEKGFDSLMTVKELRTRLYTKDKDEKVDALNHNPNELIPTQDLEPLYEENSCLYLFTKDTLFKRHHRVGYKPFLYVMSDIESMDIDYETDFIIAETLHKELEWKNEKVVLITGCSGGIGIELCHIFKRKGWIVVGTSRQECKSKFIDFSIVEDLSKEDAAKKIIKKIKDKYNRLDCIVHNAAIQICKSVEDYTLQDWMVTFQVNVFIIQQFVKESLDLLKKTKGNIINIGSVHSINTSEKISSYATSKAAIAGLTRNLCLDLGKHQIRVNSISPGAVDTPMLREGLLRGGDDIDILLKKFKEKHILGDIGKPIEIAKLVEFIANDNNGRFLNGSNIIIDGGVSARLSTE